MQDQYILPEFPPDAEELNETAPAGTAERDRPISPGTFNALQAEKREIDLLLDKGISFTTPRLSLLRYLTKQTERTFTIQQPYLGTLDRLSAEFIDMEFSEDRLKADPLGESKRLTNVNARRCGRIVAIAILNNRWKIKFLTGALANYLLWRITPAKLFQLAMFINTMSNVADFTNSIRLLQVHRTTAPDRVEKKERTGPKA